jgi:hypothetical protein
VELSADVLEIDSRWSELAKSLDTLSIPLERTDVKVVRLNAVWVPVS